MGVINLRNSDDKKIIISGMPLTLSLIEIENENIEDFFNEGKLSYAIEFIQRIDSPKNDTYFVWDGNILVCSEQDYNQYYINIIQTDLSSKISAISVKSYKEIIMYGMPLATADDKLIMSNSGFTTEEIDEYGEIFIGGIPLQVGRIKNNWYLIIFSINDNNFKRSTIRLGTGRISVANTKKPITAALTLDVYT